MAEASGGPNELEKRSSQRHHTNRQGDGNQPSGLRNTLAPLVAGPIAGVCSRFVICECPRNTGHISLNFLP